VLQKIDRAARLSFGDSTLVGPDLDPSGFISARRSLLSSSAAAQQ